MAIFLAALMVVGMIPLTQMMATETYAASGTKTVYFQNNWLWSDVRCHYWGGSSSSSYPGVAMTKIGTEEGYDLYSAEIPANTTGIQFNGLKNDNSGSRDKSPDITNIQTDVFYYMTWNNGNQVGTAPYSSGTTTEEWTIYLKPGSNWRQSTPRFAVYYWPDNGNGTWLNMTASETNGIYTAKVPSNCRNVIFGRFSASNSTNSFDTNVLWNRTGNLTIPNDGAMFTVGDDQWGDESNGATGTWGAYTPGSGSSENYNKMNEITLESNKVFYVPVDIVDYLNDNRVANNQVNGYYTDNQGEPDFGGTSQYSYLNHLISTQAYHGNFEYPMYFGPLYYISARYSKEVGSTAYKSLGKWSSAANVAIANSSGTLNADAVVQGLLSDYKLDANGNLVHKTAKDEDGNPIPFLYFSETAANQWTNNGSKVMAYYSDLQFPFVMNYDEDTRVTTYSYDSANDYAVYYDYENSKLYASSKHVLDSTADDDKSSTDYGFYPLNEPDDSGNEVNNGFGVKFTIDFTVGENGKLADGSDVTFNFTGDDDVWVFIDGVLVLDMGGAHAKASGHINFAKKTAVVDDAASVSGGAVINSGNTWENIYSGDNSYLYDNNTVERARLSNGIDSKTFSDLGLDFKYDEIHTMTVFYMERGMLESNFSMDFTMVPVPSGLTVSKDLNDSEINAGILDEVSAAEDYDFTISATSPSSTSIAFPNYSLTEKNTGLTAGKTTTVTINGNTYTALISGVTNDTYAHSFVTDKGDDAFIPGTVFTITESTKDIFSYSGTRWAIYDANNGYANITDQVKNTGANVSSKTASFTMGNVNDVTAFSYAVSFVNTMNLGTLQVKKIFSDDVLGDTEFQFKVYLDLDGTGSRDTAFTKTLYDDLVYTVNGVTKYAEDGIITLKGGETAVISGIPAGAYYWVEEIIPTNSAWYQTAVTGNEGTITSGGSATASFTNAVKHASTANDKVIYVVANTATDYTTLKYINESVSVTSVSSLTEGLTVKVNNNGTLTVTGAEAGKTYTFDYEGRLADNQIVTGQITVYTYLALDKTYVFDFGLESIISNTTTGGHGLFQGGSFVISGDNATSTLKISGTGTQTTITASGAFNESDPSVVPTVIFTPVAFMSQVETYTYTVQITANGKKYNANDPETGCVVSGTIKVMPANTVYYEDNFNVADKDNNAAQEIIFSVKGPSADPSVRQSNDQSTNYGYDSIYNGGYAQSNGSSTVLNHLDYAYFTFTGTGFDLISETLSSSAGMAVYVFEGVFNTDHLKYVTDHTDTTQTPKEMVFVNNYYANGNLYQVPVVSVRGLTTGTTYTVYIQALSTSHGSSVTIDGVRIYNPLANTDDYKANEKGVQIDELRVLYKNDYVSLAGIGSNYLFAGLGKQSVVQDAMTKASIIEDPYGNEITTAEDLRSIFLHGPNNEMYLPYNFGIHFTYTIDSTDWTLQVGAKAVTADSKAKSFTVYVKNANGTYSDDNSFVVNLTSTTDMYYDLTEKLTEIGFGGRGSYEIIILSNSEYENNEFVSLTTVKHKGIAFQANN